MLLPALFCDTSYTCEGLARSIHKDTSEMSLPALHSMYTVGALYLLLVLNVRASFVCFPIFWHSKVQKTSISIQNWILDLSSTKKNLFMKLYFIQKKNETIFSFPLILLFSVYIFPPYLPLLCHAHVVIFNAVRPDLLQKLTFFKCYSTQFITFT